MAMQKLDRIELARVQYIPKELKPGVLYVAEEFSAAVHLCACGCGSKVSTPLGPSDWTLEEAVSGASLTPSIGNWQLPCRSHYWIHEGKIIWSGAWTPAQIAAGRRSEEARRRTYYDNRKRPRRGAWRMVWDWIRSLFE
jgi:hypothetical protein